MTAKEFAAEMELSYFTILKWLKAGLVPGAVQIEPFPGMTTWSIPESALSMERPRYGEVMAGGTGAPRKRARKKPRK